MRRRLVLATKNQGKVRELRDILDGLDVTLLSAADIDLPDTDETADTFAGNAILKAVDSARATGLACVADDSGLVVDALGGEPGIFSARYAGPQRDDEANLDLVLARLDATGDGDRRGRFVCAAAAALPDGTVEVVEGAVEGRILRARRGTGGFGYDPIFQPDGSPHTTAEMTPAQKHAISHRGKAFRALRPVIERFLDA